MSLFKRLFSELRNIPWWGYVILSVVLIAASFYIPSFHSSSVGPREVSYSEFDKQLQDGKLTKVTLRIFTYQAEGERDGRDIITTIPGSYGTEAITKDAAKAHVKTIKIDSKTGNPSVESFVGRLLRFLPTLIFVVMGYLIYTVIKEQLGSSKIPVQPVTSEIGFKDVAGVDEVREELDDIVRYLKDPKQFKRLGAQVPTGVMLYGPPGTGKTLLAKALAHEAKVPFYAVDGSSFVELYAGAGAGRVRDLFRQVRDSAPAIVFIDEIDSLARKRGEEGGGGGAREADQTLNALLTAMDGFHEQAEPVIIVGATNQLDLLDAALLRPGRFDRQISVDAPDKTGRLQILKIHSKGKPLAKDVDLDRLASRSAGMTGADLANVLNESALLAVRRDAKQIEAKDVEEALFKILAGPAKARRFDEDTRKRIAYHEAGHAIVGEKLGWGRVEKISLVPRGLSGGQTIHVDEQDHQLYTPSQLTDRLAILLGGRAAEKIALGEISSGAEDDLQRANDLAKTMVVRLGMGDTVGLRVVGREGASAQMQGAIEKEILVFLDEAFEKATSVLIEQRQALTRITDELLITETLDREAFLNLL